MDEDKNEDMQSANDRSAEDGPIALPLPWGKISLVAVLILVAAVGFFFLMQRARGNFVMGVIGVVAQYFVAVVFILLVGFLALPVVAGIRSLSHIAGRIAAALAALVITAVFAWIFLAAPILDIPHLSSPSVTRLTEVEVEVDDSYESSTFYKLQGTDTEGNLQIFDVDRAVFDAWDAEVDEVTVTYLPHTETVLSLVCS